jgi:hypothetical protein
MMKVNNYVVQDISGKREIDVFGLRYKSHRVEGAARSADQGPFGCPLCDFTATSIKQEAKT